MGEAALTAGHRHDAVSALRGIAPALESIGRRESAWRAWAWLALAESGTPDSGAARRARENAGELRHETEKAYLLFDGNKEVWVAKALCEWDGDSKTMQMPEWVALEKGLI